VSFENELVPLNGRICLPQVKRVPGSSGRVHKNTEGEWVWSDDEMKDDANEPASVAVSAVVIVACVCHQRHLVLLLYTLTCLV